MTAPRRPASADARAIAAAVSAVPSVAGLDSGRHGEIALLYPGERVPGLRWTGGRLEIHLRAAFDPAAPRPLAETCQLARGAAADVLGSAATVDVIVSDVALAGQVVGGASGVRGEEV